MTKRQKEMARLKAQHHAGMIEWLNSCPKRYLDPEGKHEAELGTPEYETALYEEVFVGLTATQAEEFEKRRRG